MRLPCPKHLIETLAPFAAGSDLAGLYARVVPLKHLGGRERHVAGSRPEPANPIACSQAGRGNWPECGVSGRRGLRPG